MLLLQIEITHLQAGIIFGAALGAVIGLIPLILGIVKKNLKIGFLGFIGAIIGNAILGILLSIPIAGICTYLVLKSKNKPVDVDAVNKDIDVRTEN